MKRRRSSMDTAPEDPPLPSGLRALQRLVTVLMVVMILGFLVLVAALVMRLNTRGPELPDSLVIPDGSSPVAFTQGADWFAVVVRDDEGAERILIYDRLTGRLRQEVGVEPEIADAP